MAVSSTSLREKGNVLLSGVTADQEKEPRGGKSKTSPVRPGRFSPPGVWRVAEWLSGPSRPGGQGDVPPTVSSFLLSATITVTLMAPGLIFGDDKWLRKKSCTSLGIWCSAQY